MRVLNLASQPFRNERLPNLAVTILAVFVLGLTVEHALVIRRLRPGRALGPQVASLEEESRRLRADGERFRGTRPDPEASAHWLVLKDLVDRKVFSWTRLFSVLEATLPQAVRLVSIVPTVQKGEVSLTLDAVARSKDDGLDFIRVLEEREEFYEVIPTSRGGEDGTTFNYTMKYKETPPAPAPAGPAPPAGAGPQVQGAGKAAP